MKLRNGFVSNSSSSSFIIKADKTEDGFIKIKPEDIGQCLRTEAEVKTYIEDTCLWGEEKFEDLEDYDLEKYNEYIKIIKSGKVIIIGSIEQGSEEDVQGYFRSIGLEWDN